MARFSWVFLLAAFAITLGYRSAPAFAQSQPPNVPLDASGITDPAEYQAYIEALSTDNPFAINKFVKRYPQSSALQQVLEHAIAPSLESTEYIWDYWASGDDEILDFAERLHEIAPDDVRALAVITTFDAKRVAIGKHDAIQKMCSDSQSGLKQLPHWGAPSGMARSEFRVLRNNMAYTFNVFAGQCSYLEKDFVGARSFFRGAVQVFPTRLVGIYGLTLSDLEEPIDSQGFGYCGKAIQLLQQTGGNGRRSATALATYCRSISRRVLRTGESQTAGQPTAGQTLPPDLLALDGNNVKPH